MHSKPDGHRRRIGRFFPPAAGWLGVSLALTLGALVGCSEKSNSAPTEGGGSRRSAGAGKVPVVVATVITKEMPLVLDGIGAVESMRSVAVKSLVTGALMKVGFNEGQEVKRGDLLFEIDPRPFENALHSAEADLEKTTVQLQTAEAELKRYTSLVESGMVSREQFESVQNTARSLHAAEISNGAAVANAKLQLDYAFIRAPCDGRTGALGAHEGDIVRASDPNVSLVTVTQLAPIYVTFSLPQQTLATIQQYQAAGPITVHASPSATDALVAHGELSFLDSSIDAATGTIKLKATFANARHLLWPGLFVRVSMTLATLPDQVVVPTPAVQVGQKGQQVFVVRADKTVELRRVVVARSNPTETVIERGLSTGETVVVDGQIRLRPDAPVVIKLPVEDIAATRNTGKKVKSGDPAREKSGKKDSLVPGAGGGGGSANAAESP